MASKISVLVLALVVSALVSEHARAAPGNASVAALQVALRARGLYAGAVDGLPGPQTERAVRRLQHRSGLVADGVVGPRTRRALGRYARPRLGARVLRPGRTGWDVAALQFVLAWHGFASGWLDGRFGPKTERALRRFQRWAGLRADGVAGGATLAALRSRPPLSPLRLSWPLRLPIGDTYGPRGARFHCGIDFPADSGTAVGSAGSGRVIYAGWHPSGLGYLVTVAHNRVVKTRYAHLSRVMVRLGERVAAGQTLGLVGSSGYSTGPHLHFEVRVRGAAVDPMTALQ